MKTLGIEAAAAFLLISADTLKDLAADGSVPGAKIGREWLFIDEDLEKYARDAVRRQTAERRGTKAHVATEATRLRRRRSSPPPTLEATT